MEVIAVCAIVPLYIKMNFSNQLTVKRIPFSKTDYHLYRFVSHTIPYPQPKIMLYPVSNVKVIIVVMKQTEVFDNEMQG